MRSGESGCKNTIENRNLNDGENVDCIVFNSHRQVKQYLRKMEYSWLSYEEAMQRITWDSNKTALYELNCRLLSKG